VCRKLPLTFNNCLPESGAATKGTSHPLMSPIAGDAAFLGTVRPDGMGISGATVTLELDWPQVGLLAGSLSAAIGQRAFQLNAADRDCPAT
jgi:hypothetical protein